MAVQKQQKLTEKDITDRLRHIIDPVTGTNVIAANLVSGITIKGNNVGVMITIGKDEQEIRGVLQQVIHDALKNLEGVAHVTAVLTAQTGAEHQAPKEASSGKAKWNLTPIENVCRVIAVASGKGGVGKSTVTAALAMALMREGKRVGILDADIYGPSMPHMFGISGKPDYADNRMIPPEANGIQIMSVGLLLDPSQAAIMRGPMISKTLHQLTRGTAWGNKDEPLDILLIDMPPGTGDVHLSMVQNIPMAHNQGGAIIVTTPSDVAVLDAQKCATMFNKTHVPILGVVENMSYFEDTHGTRHAIFGEGGGKNLAKQAKCELLQSIPLSPSIRNHADSGTMAQLDTAHIDKNWAQLAQNLCMT